jgi:hypothetical protein
LLPGYSYPKGAAVVKAMPAEDTFLDFKFEDYLN